MRITKRTYQFTYKLLYTLGIASMLAGILLSLVHLPVQAAVEFADPPGHCGEGYVYKAGSDPFEYNGSEIITSLFVKAASPNQGQYCFEFTQDGNNGCYTVSGLGTSHVTVTNEQTRSEKCYGISHVEFYADHKPPTETETEPPPTETETDTPTETCTETETTTPPTDTETPPTETETPPTETETPTDTVTPPTDTSTPPTETVTPPTDTATPPTETVTPPTDTSTPPTETVTPPTETVTPTETITPTEPITSTVTVTPTDAQTTTPPITTTEPPPTESKTEPPPPPINTAAPPVPKGTPSVLVPVTGADRLGGGLQLDLYSRIIMNLGLGCIGLAFVLQGIGNQMGKD